MMVTLFLTPPPISTMNSIVDEIATTECNNRNAWPSLSSGYRIRNGYNNSPFICVLKILEDGSIYGYAYELTMVSISRQEDALYRNLLKAIEQPIALHHRVNAPIFYHPTDFERIQTPNIEGLNFIYDHNGQMWSLILYFSYAFMPEGMPEGTVTLSSIFNQIIDIFEVEVK